MLGTQIEADTIGAAWLGVAQRILDQGAESEYDAARILELARVTVGVARPASVDPIVTELGMLSGSHGCTRISLNTRSWLRWATLGAMPVGFTTTPQPVETKFSG
jgi:hypothetical protein